MSRLYPDPVIMALAADSTEDIQRVDCREWGQDTFLYTVCGNNRRHEQKYEARKRKSVDEKIPNNNVNDKLLNTFHLQPSFAISNTLH